MSQDRQLIETIKTNFARKSSAQLQEIVQAANQERWSPEAISAAAEVLQDRKAGCAQEPAMPEDEPQPLNSPPLPYSLGFVFGFLPIFALNGLRFGSEFADYKRDSSDLPVPFGPKMAWLALQTTDAEAVGTALGLQEAKTATWSEGIDAASQSSVFVTPPLGDWTLVVSTALFPPVPTETFIKPLLERLSRQFGDAQYFCTHWEIELHVWARARKGRLVRGYGWLGQKTSTLWDEGEPTREERDLGLRSLESQCPVAEGTVNKNSNLPDERRVMQLASLWSVNPTTLDKNFKRQDTGLLGHCRMSQKQNE